MKSSFKSFFKAFNLLQILLIAVVVMLFTYLGANASKMISANGDTLAKTINAILYISLGGVALLGLSNLQSNKMCVIDLTRVGGLIGSIGGLIIYLLKKPISLINVIFFAAIVGVLFVEIIVRLIIGKIENDKPTGYKAYFANLSNAFNPVIIALLGVGFAFAFMILFKFDGSLFEKIEPLYVGIVVGVAALVLLFQSIITSNKITIVDLLANILVIASLAVCIYGFRMNDFPYFRMLLLTLVLFGSVYFRALAFTGELAKPCKIKLHSYYQAVNTKYDYNVALGVGALAVALTIVPTFYVNYLNALVKYFGFNFTLDKFDMYFTIASIAIVGLLILGYVIFRKLKSDKIVFFDLINNTLGYAAIFTIPAVLLVIDDFSALTSNILLLVSLGVLVLAFILSLIFMFVRSKYYQANTLELASTAAEATESELIEENEEEVVTEEEPVEENEEEIPVVEETTDVVEDAVASESVDDIEQPATEEVVEEVVYVDEDGNVIENPEEVINQEVETADVVEEEISDEDLADQFTEEEIAEILGEVPPQPVTDEYGLTEEELAMLDALPDINDKYAQAPEEEVVYIDEDGNVIENPEEFMTSEEAKTEDSEVEETVAEETVVEEVAAEEIPAELPTDVVAEETSQSEEDTEDEAEADDEDSDEEDLEPEIEEVIEEVEEETKPEAKEKNIIMPEVQLLDENGEVKKIKRKFNTRMMFAPYEAKEYYNEIKNYLEMYRAKGRNSSRCETFRYKGLIAKVALAGKSIKVCLAIDPTSLEGSKYHYKDVSDKKQYAEVPTMIKVRSQRGLKYFKELVDMMMAVRGVKPKRGFEPTNYLPSLIPNGEAIMATIGLSTDYLYGFMNVKSIPADMPDDLIEYLPVIQAEELEEEEIKATVYLDTLCQHFEDGDEITIDVLKSLHIVTRGNVLNIKARGTLDRKLIIYAEYFDPDALKMLMCTNCTAVKIIR